MAGIHATVYSGEIVLTNPDPKTLLQLTISNARALIREISVTINDVPDSNVSVLVEVLFQTGAGSGLLSVTPTAHGSPTYTSALTCIKGKDTGQTDPTPGNVIMGKNIPTLGGEFLFMAIRETDKIPLNDGQRIGVRVTADAAYKAVAYAIVEE